jgi:hypothetical protein
MTGPAPRYLRIGRALMSSIKVGLAVPAETAPSLPGIATRPYSSEIALRAIVDAAAIALVPGALFDMYPSLVRTPARLVMDTSDCRQIRRDALRAGEFFLCGSDVERVRGPRE